MTRVLLVVAGVVLAIVAALVLYLTFADLGRFKPQIETSVSQALGREFRIAGELRPKVLPRLSIVAAGITLANADWGAPAPMVEVGQVRGEIRLWSLLFGPITMRTSNCATSQFCSNRTRPVTATGPSLRATPLSSPKPAEAGRGYP